MHSDAQNVGKMRLNTHEGHIDPIRIDTETEDGYGVMSKYMS